MIRIKVKLNRKEYRTILNDDIKIGLKILYSGEEWEITSIIGTIPNHSARISLKVCDSHEKSWLSVTELKKLCKMICTI